MTMVARLLLTLAFAVSPAVLAQSYPSRAVKVVVPWPPGQATDIVARIVAERLASVLGQPFVIDNRPGAGGVIGTEQASKAPADGYTLLAGSSGPITISPNVQQVAYDPQRDFAPISLFQTNQYVVVVNPQLPVNDLKELIALLRANPGKYSYSSAGNASTQHLCLELFNFMAQVKATHVPYKGSVPSLTDLMSGQVTYTMETLPAVVNHMKAGRLKGLAVSKTVRSALLPDMPTIGEEGLPGYDMSGWIGLMAPAATPRDVIARLSGEVRRMLQAPETREKLLALGMEPEDLTPEEFAEFIRRQHARYGAIAKQANVRVD